jgi:hypothetical protein
MKAEGKIAKSLRLESKRKLCFLRVTPNFDRGFAIRRRRRRGGGRVRPGRRQLCAAAGNSDLVIIIQKRETVAWIPSGNITSTAERLSSILGIGTTGVRKIALACFRRWLLREDAV